MKFCMKCGGKLHSRIPERDNRERMICSDCGFIHYENPKIVVGALPVFGEKILLCRRAIEPRLGFWTLPAGYMENGENLEECAARETWEEANAEIRVRHLHSLFSVPPVNQVHVFFQADLISEDFSPGVESLDVRLFSEEEIPWDDLAFEAVKHSLSQYFSDRKNGSGPPHVSSLAF